MVSSKKILHVVNISFVLPYYIGGQFDHFSKRGYKFYVACSPSDHLYQYSKEKGFSPFPVHILRKIHPLADIKSILLLKKLIIDEDIDIVIGHTPKGAMISMVAAYLAGKKNRIYFRHGLMYETSTGIKRKILKKIEIFTGNLATKVICVSSSVLNKSITEELNNPLKNLLLNLGTCNGIDCDKFNRKNLDTSSLQFLREKYEITSDFKIVGYVGRLVKDKGITELIEAWKIISSRSTNVKLLLVGPFEERDSISQDLKDWISYDSSIIHTGLISDVLPYYGLMNIFILPSYREGFPTVVLEASAMELPVITTMATGCKDSILENQTGRFTEIDPVSIAQNIEFYLSDDQTANLHGEKGREFVTANFRQELIWEEIEKKILND